MNNNNSNRRPIAARGSAWARRFAGMLARSNISPNQISVLSVICAGAGVAALLLASPVAGLIGFAISIQARLICNLLDGMVAIEGGKKSALGGIYNEFPDRIADSLFIVAVGYFVMQPWLGWCGALMAALTAYVRVFGGSLGLAQDFRGPMAKQHRMAVLTIAALLGALEWHMWQTRYALIAAGYVVAIGATLTCITRTLAIGRQLDARQLDAQQLNKSN
jgi:phosphatidylglycerophosphate synthase